MKLRNSLSGETFEGVLTTDSSASSYGQPVLVVDGEALGSFEAACLRIVEASDDEREDLQLGGYSLLEA